MTNPIDTIKRPIKLRIDDMRLDFNLKRPDIAALDDSGLVTTRVGVHRRAMAIIEEQAALIKQMREALLAAERSLHTACIMTSLKKVDEGGVEELLHYANQVEAHVVPAWKPVAEALKLSAPYAELEDL